jgi:hypothetical protein
MLIATVVLGVAGSLSAIAVAGRGTYRVGPLVVEMRARPALKGTTEIEVRLPPEIGVSLGHTEAQTHSGFLAFRGTVVSVDVNGGVTALRTAVLRDPLKLATTIRDDGRSATRQFILKLGLLTVGGGAAGGLPFALFGMRTRRILQGLLAGTLVVAIMGVIAWQTYDINAFSRTTFKQKAVGASVLHR